MVNIYLSSDQGSVLALTIPPSDIERLSVRPLKWLRYVMFAVCGARGDLSATPAGTPIAYDSISHADIADAYYYTPEEDYRLVDCNGLNDRETSSAKTPCRSQFRAEVIERDGQFCIFTRYNVFACDAAHIIPRSKGDQYISTIFEDRRHLYVPSPIINDINSVENGILLSKDLHSMFSRGAIAFLRTPNFALDTVDIPRFETDEMPPNRITLQLLELTASSPFQPLQARDAIFRGTRISPPLAILLDYHYGVAAYRRWGTKEMDHLMQDRFSEHYKTIPMPPQSLSSSDCSDLGDHRDMPSRWRHHSSDISPKMDRAMDKVLMLSMLLKGTTPKAIAAERQRREKEEELRAQTAGRAKVQEWLKSNARSLSCTTDTASKR